MLNSARVLILEDEILLGLDLANAVQSANGVAVGPVPSVVETLALLGTQKVSAAIIDFRLVDRDATPVVERLVSDGTPMVFYTANELPLAITLAYPHIPVFKKMTNPEFLLTCLFDIINAKQCLNDRSATFQSDECDPTLLALANRQILNICSALDLDTDYFEKHQSPERNPANLPSRFDQLRRIADALRNIVDPAAKNHLERLLFILADEASDADRRSRLSH